MRGLVRPPSRRLVAAKWTLLGVVVVLLVVGGEAAKTYAEVDRAFHRPRTAPEKPSALADRLHDVTLTTSSGINVGAWYLPAGKGGVIVYVHGSAGDRRDLWREAAALAPAGYGALLLDTPGHGTSGGHITWGTDDQAAMRAALDFLVVQEHIDPRRIGAHGFSMGAALVARVASDDARIHAVVLAAPFTSIADQIGYQFRRWGPVTQRPAVAACESNGLAFEELRPVDVVARIAPRPLLLIAGDRDPMIPASMTRAVFDAARMPKDLYVVPGGAHGGYAESAGAEYFDRLRRFWDAALAAE
jgi:alpha-beta hydrolase superfamily lysophospholipase